MSATDPRTGENIARRRARQKKRVTAWRAANTALRERHRAEFFELFEAAKEESRG